MNKIKFWKSFGELNSSKAYEESLKDEFSEELPVEPDDKGLFDAVAPRRDFLKYLGFSTAAAAIAASCEIPVKKAIPFANKPENIVPGVPDYYATTFVQEGDAVSILAKVMDGRPIKIEGNELSPYTLGGTMPRVQASVLDLYDTARLRFPTISGKEVTLEAIDKEVGPALASTAGGAIVLLTTTVNSPSSLEVINQFLAKYPGSRHVQYDAVSYSGMLLANEMTYGKRMIPTYHFEKAKTIVSIGADFLSTWLSPTEFNRQYSVGKRINEKNPAMSKHIQFESLLSLTGANADERYLHRPSETGAVVSALYSAINGGGVSGIADAKLKAGIERAAKFLTESRGASLVVCGSNDVNVQVMVNAINEALQSGGNTIDHNTVMNTRKGIDSDFVRLVEDMNAGNVGALLIFEANPAFSYYDSNKFVEGLKKVKLSVSFCGKNDETTQLCKYVVPSNHFLESWGDAEANTGLYSFIQPTIYPLFKTRQWQDSLLKWSGSPLDYLAFLKQYWITKLGSETMWNKALQDGVVINMPAAAGGAVYNGGYVATASSALSSAKKGGKTELVLYENVGIGSGMGATNPWLQELPDPITRCTWDNYVVLSPAMAKSLLDIDLNDNGESDAYEAHPPKPLVSVTANGKTMELPALIIPGTHPDCIGIAVGYGRSEKLGKTAAGVGKNVYPFVQFNGNTMVYAQTDITIKDTGRTYDVALIQTHNTYDTPLGKRVEVMKELSLASFIDHPTQIPEERNHELAHFGGTEDFTKQGTMYPYYDKPGIHWGMGIDLNTCTGCGACVVACIAENNVPIVGKSEVMRFHDMHWLRIDRYYSGDIDNPTVVFQPMLCQHCDNAPCENVCPVSATNHSSEGLNQMAYNRCIGTRYCANNCPYKVRRFNWADYTGADSFPDNQHPGFVGDLDPAVHQMNDDLSRMVLNPDVTVRSRGVMEKCTFCVQRLQDGKLKAKKESRPLESGVNDKWDVKTACQQACPTNAIIFGNINDKNSAIAQFRVNNYNRTFYVIEQIHTLPNVNYLAKVRNTELTEEEKHERLEKQEHLG